MQMAVHWQAISLRKIWCRPPQRFTYPIYEVAAHEEFDFEFAKNEPSIFLDSTENSH